MAGSRLGSMDTRGDLAIEKKELQGKVKERKRSVHISYACFRGGGSNRSQQHLTIFFFFFFFFPPCFPFPSLARAMKGREMKDLGPLSIDDDKEQMSKGYRNAWMLGSKTWNARRTTRVSCLGAKM